MVGKQLAWLSRMAKLVWLKWRWAEQVLQAWAWTESSWWRAERIRDQDCPGRCYRGSWSHRGPDQTHPVCPTPAEPVFPEFPRVCAIPADSTRRHAGQGTPG